MITEDSMCRFMCHFRNIGSAAGNIFQLLCFFIEFCYNYSSTYVKYIRPLDKWTKCKELYITKAATEVGFEAECDRENNPLCLVREQRRS